MESPTKNSPYRRESRSVWDLVFLAASMGLTVAAFALNMGWWRVFIFLSAAPVVFALLHLILGLMVVWLRVRSSAFYALCITHPVSYILLYDFGDTGDPYIFFGLLDLPDSKVWLGETLAYFAGLSMVLTALLSVFVGIQIWRGVWGRSDTD